MVIEPRWNEQSRPINNKVRQPALQMNWQECMCVPINMCVYLLLLICQQGMPHSVCRTENASSLPSNFWMLRILCCFLPLASPEIKFRCLKSVLLRGPWRAPFPMPVFSSPGGRTAATNAASAASPRPTLSHYWTTSTLFTARNRTALQPTARTMGRPSPPSRRSPRLTSRSTVCSIQTLSWESPFPRVWWRGRS